ncbi:hypothetical protein MJO28_002519 [Puccinia striiformis f. sp. tritici]|uniref:Uncharacterized protein n=1 Tax=Puccinia striiformis f. sp. tritici TaxID=168172 RepID=A0ACC0ERL2_9BASI|nr:hypothetical protein MJO28_002519 [Puccinia striiformis f. sp. tritici]KAI7964494.1 hypothetical protein MJO29_002592 [Puccinia striiformis f. sp. tritici]
MQGLESDQVQCDHRPQPRNGAAAGGNKPTATARASLETTPTNFDTRYLLYSKHQIVYVRIESIESLNFSLEPRDKSIQSSSMGMHRVQPWLQMT